MEIKLQQGQVWKQGDSFLRIVRLARLEVEYKSITDIVTREGTRHHVTKKEFCRLLKGATLLPPVKNAGPETPLPPPRA